MNNKNDSATLMGVIIRQAIAHCSPLPKAIITAINETPMAELFDTSTAAEVNGICLIASVPTEPNMLEVEEDTLDTGPHRFMFVASLPSTKDGDKKPYVAFIIRPASCDLVAQAFHLVGDDAHVFIKNLADGAKVLTGREGW